MRTARAAIRADKTLTTRHVASELAITVDQYRRLQRGESQLLLADMHIIAARLGLSLHSVGIEPGPPRTHEGGGQ